jgi:hypothetical protein
VADADYCPRCDHYLPDCEAGGCIEGGLRPDSHVIGADEDWREVYGPVTRGYRTEADYLDGVRR